MRSVAIPKAYPLTPVLTALSVLALVVAQAPRSLRLSSRRAHPSDLCRRSTCACGWASHLQPWLLMEQSCNNLELQSDAKNPTVSASSSKDSAASLLLTTCTQASQGRSRCFLRMCTGTSAKCKTTGSKHRTFSNGLKQRERRESSASSASRFLVLLYQPPGTPSNCRVVRRGPCRAGGSYPLSSFKYP